MHLGKTKEVERIAAAHTVSPVISAGEGLLGGLEDRFLSLRRLLELMPDGVALVDELGVIRYVNERLIVMTGYPRDELVGESVESLLPSQRRSRHVVDRAKYFVNPRARQMGADLDLSLLRRDGTELAIDVALTTITFTGKPWIVAAVRDDSVARAAERARTASEQRFRLAFDDNMAPMVFSDAEELAIAVNDAFCRMVGFAREELLSHDSKQFTYPEDVGITEENHHRLIAGDVGQVRYVKRCVRKDGRVVVVEVARSAARDADGKTLYLVSSERDVTEERALTAQLSHQALHDPLTGLANRALFEDRLAQAHARVVRQGGLGAVLIVDLDDFKGVNDTHGHLVGDRVLASIAHRLKEVTRPSDTLCRLGGDEFLYLLEGLASAAEAEQVANRLLDAFSEPLSIDGVRFEQRASVGIVVWDATCTDCTELIQNADVAMYEAKSRAKGHHVVFAPGMRQQATSRFTLIQELRGALHAGELAMHYQPIVSLTTTEVVGFEALMRWQHPERGWVPPDLFIPLAERSELILELGSFALHEAVAAACTWQRTSASARALYVTVNLSARQFHDPGLVPMIEGVLHSSGLAPRDLIIEITESVALYDIAETLSVLEHLNELGIGIALDDFGTGYSSLSYLVLLHPRIIKIDRSFVSPAHESARNDTLLETIVSLGQKLNAIVLTEGIETKTQLGRLRDLDCELGQGYLFSPAVPVSEVAITLSRMEGRRSQNYGVTAVENGNSIEDRYNP